MPRYPAGAGGTSGKGPFWPLPGVLCAPAVRRRRGELGAGPRGWAGPGRPPRYAWVGWDARVRSWGAAVQTASSLYLYIVNAHMQGATAGQPPYERWGGGGIFGPRGSQLVGKSPWLGSAAHFSWPLIETTLGPSPLSSYQAAPVPGRVAWGWGRLHPSPRASGACLGPNERHEPPGPAPGPIWSGPEKVRVN